MRIVWFNAIEPIREEPLGNSTTVSDYLKFALFAKMRRREVKGFLWKDVNLKDRSFIRNQTKNGDPLFCHYLTTFMNCFWKERCRLNEYVFFGRYGIGCLQEPKKQIKRVVEVSGVEFSSHDLRRTFLSAAESLDINYYTLKRLVNHKTDGDVTSGYISMDLEKV